ncbi:MAG: hypothetical protein HQL47_07720, partial [Gammaproteobacteria bacterium]|nr:hypothetical protein [Gammaproteobacteria bacterium]
MKRFKKILYIRQANEKVGSNLARVRSLADNNQAELCLATVVPDIRGGFGLPPDGPTGTTLQTQVIADARTELSSLLQDWPGESMPQQRVLVGNDYIQIIRPVLRNG